MAHFHQEKKITYFIVVSFILHPLVIILSSILYPPDLNNEFPVYDSRNLMFMVCASSLFIAALTVLGIKLADEKKVLPAAGFTMLAISSGILLTSIFEISQVVSYETYEKFYRIQSSGNFLFLPAMYLISGYEDFKKWIRYIGLASSLVLITSTLMFLSGNRDFQTLEAVSNVGFSLMFITSFSWAYNVYINFKKNQG